VTGRRKALIKSKVGSAPKRRAPKKKRAKEKAGKKPATKELPRALVLAESLTTRVEGLEARLSELAPQVKAGTEARIEDLKRLEAELRTKIGELENRLTGSPSRTEYEAGLAKLRSTIQDVDSRLTRSVDSASETVRSALQDVESKMAETLSRQEVESKLDDLAAELARLVPRNELESKLSESISRVERRTRDVESRVKEELEKMRSALKERGAEASTVGEEKQQE